MECSQLDLYLLIGVRYRALTFFSSFGLLRLRLRSIAQERSLNYMEWSHRAPLLIGAPTILARCH